MQGFTIVDAVVAGVVILSALLAYSRGFVREVMAIVGWVAAGALAYNFAGPVVPLVQELPVVGSYLTNSCELATIAAFACVFAVALIVVSLFTPLLSSMIQNTILGGVDMGAGLLFGVARGVILVAVAFIVYGRAVGAQGVPMVENSRSAAIFAGLRGNLEADIPASLPAWVEDSYSGLTRACPAPAQG